MLDGLILDMNGRSWPRLCNKSLDFTRSGTAAHICNDWSASKTFGPTLITRQPKCGSHLPPLLEILRFYTASADSGLSFQSILHNLNDRFRKKQPVDLDLIGR